MKKKNLIARLGVLALVCTLVTTSLVSGTYSKYVKTATGSDTARVAKFAFNLKDKATGGTTLNQSTSTGSFKLFDYTDTGVYANGVNSGKFLAPGTTGTLNLQLDNLSEVKVSAAFELTETNASIPVYYTLGAVTQRYSKTLTGSYTGGGTYLTLTDLGTAMAQASVDASDGSTAVSNSYALNWTWDFNGSGSQTDATDTALGTATTAPTIKLDIKATVTQLDT